MSLKPLLTGRGSYAVWYPNSVKSGGRGEEFSPKGGGRDEGETGGIRTRENSLAQDQLLAQK